MGRRAHIPRLRTRGCEHLLPMADHPPVVLLRMEYLESAHEAVAELFEDDPEPMPAWREGDRSKLETLCQCTEVAAFGHEKYPDFHVKVSKFFYSAIKLHPFPNGNKRFALMATIYFLLVNDCELKADIDFSPTTMALIVARSNPHTSAGKPDIVVELLADVYFKHAIVPEGQADEGLDEADEAAAS